MDFSKNLPRGFSEPTALPTDSAQAQAWQDSNRAWWDTHPMRYDWNDELRFAEGSAEFYREIDQRFFRDATEYLPPRSRPFDRLIPFDRLSALDVLEIGVGAGSHAGLLAERARSFTGIDLTETAVATTRARMERFGLRASILQMDAERMTFPDASFDFVWSWGVIHHSADTGAVLAQIRRVLRSGGRAVVMVYHRNWWNYYVLAGLFHGLIRGLWRTHRSLHEILQRTTDGGLARYYTASEWASFATRYLHVDAIDVYGTRSHLLPLPPCRLKSTLLRALPTGLTRFMNHRLRMGQFLVAQMSSQ